MGGNRDNVFIQIFIIYLQHLHIHTNRERLFLWGNFESENENERLTCSNLMTQDLALYLDLMLQDFILILNKCSHTGTKNKTGKCCLSFPLCCCHVFQVYWLFCPTNVGQLLLFLFETEEEHLVSQIFIFGINVLFFSLPIIWGFCTSFKTWFF